MQTSRNTEEESGMWVEISKGCFFCNPSAPFIMFITSENFGQFLLSVISCQLNNKQKVCLYTYHTNPGWSTEKITLLCFWNLAFYCRCSVWLQKHGHAPGESQKVRVYHKHFSNMWLISKLVHLFLLAHFGLIQFLAFPSRISADNVIFYQKKSYFLFLAIRILKIKGLIVYHLT